MLRHTARGLRMVLVLLAAALLAVTGCGTGDTLDTGTTPSGTATSPTSSTSPAAAGSPTAGSPTAGPTTVTATLTEFKITLSATAFSPGLYAFVAEQKGQRTHALSIKGPGVDTKTTPVIEPGGPSQRLIVTLQPGTYELWCPISHHRAQGMAVTITVR